MRLSAILTGLIILILVAAAGCTGTTANPELTPDLTVTPTPALTATPAETLLPHIVPGETYLLVEYAGRWGGVWTAFDGVGGLISGPGDQRIDIEKRKAIVASVSKMDSTEDLITVSLYVDGRLVATNSTVEGTPISVTWKGL